MDTRQKYEFTIPGAKVQLIERTYRSNDHRDFYSAPRMYVEIGEKFNVLESLTNRTRRPFNVYKTHIHSTVLGQIMDLSKLSWSQKAGCTMCPCSPGFILNWQTININNLKFTNFDMWILLEEIPSHVNEAKPGRMLVGV